MQAEEIAFATWIGAFLLGVCGLFQAFYVWRDAENARGLSWEFLIVWGSGELWMFAGMIRIASLHVLANYVLNVVLICYMMGVKWCLPNGVKR